ncbi:hypothetical protein Agub_g3642 [Astrephomene gubernaculifera]|uniref:Uncharacterized protein n=1 Tax=Astrephomene gubernaculifera TaxID=47775 RepID=A0AAD3HIM9_9CHLO|nr:hypothetical protein Agub_g3642 [Astrephomene gubernaculifera]
MNNPEMRSELWGMKQSRETLVFSVPSLSCAIRGAHGLPKLRACVALIFVFSLYGPCQAEMPLYIPADVPCSELWSFYSQLNTEGSADTVVWEEAGDACGITYHGAAVTTPDGRTSLSHDTTYHVNKELLSHVLNTIRRAKERDSRHVGDPFIAPYLAGVYQRLGLEYASLICFPRITLAWRRLAAAAAAGPATQPAAAMDVPGDGGKEASAGEGEARREDAVPSAATAAEATEEEEVASTRASAAPEMARRLAARVVPLEWHMQQLHRELVLEVRQPCVPYFGCCSTAAETPA